MLDGSYALLGGITSRLYPRKYILRKMSADSNHWVFKTVLPGSAAQQVCVGCFRVAGHYDTVVGRGNAIELFVAQSSGRLGSLCRQPVFGTIKDLQTYKRPDLAQDEVK